VANEVIQISKRNRGNKYLESFSPILGGSLKYICERDPNVTDKVRRTAKIWGDRRIFSTRYVGEILTGLKQASIAEKQQPRFSPEQSQTPQLTTTSSQQSKNDDDSIQLFDNNNDNDEHNDNNDMMIRMESPTHHHDIDDDPFSNSGPSLLDVSNFRVNKQALLGRDSNDNDIFANSPKKKQRTTKRRKAALSTSSLIELVDQLSNFDAESKNITRILSSIQSSTIYTSTTEEEEGMIEQVGDELIELHTQTNSMIVDVKRQKKNLWRAAEGKRTVETEFKRYLNWLQAGLNTDEDEIGFCNDLERKLTLLQLVHGALLCYCVTVLLLLD
jgi:hypothetical protein